MIASSSGSLPGRTTTSGRRPRSPRAVADEVAQALAARVDDAVERVGRDVGGADGRLERGAQVGREGRLGDVELVEADRARGERGRRARRCARSMNGPSSGLSSCVKATSSSPQPHHFIWLIVSSALLCARGGPPRSAVQVDACAGMMAPRSSGRRFRPARRSMASRAPRCQSGAWSITGSEPQARWRTERRRAATSSACAVTSAPPSSARRASCSARRPVTGATRAGAWRRGRTRAAADAARRGSERAAGAAHAAQHDVDVVGLRPVRACGRLGGGGVDRRVEVRRPSRTGGRRSARGARCAGRRARPDRRRRRGGRGRGPRRARGWRRPSGARGREGARRTRARSPPRGRGARARSARGRARGAGS